MTNVAARLLSHPDSDAQIWRASPQCSKLWILAQHHDDRGQRQPELPDTLQRHCLGSTAGEGHLHFLTDVSSLQPNSGEAYWGCPHPRSSAEAGVKAMIGDFLRAA